MKNKKIIIFGSLIIIVFYIFYNLYWSDAVRKGKKNKSNSEKITKGMSKTDIYRIMGEPDTIINGGICYLTNDDSYPYIEFSFDEKGKVLEIHSPNKIKKP